MLFYKNICLEVFDSKNINSDILEMNNLTPSYTRQGQQTSSGSTDGNYE